MRIARGLLLLSLVVVSLWWISCGDSNQTGSGDNVDNTDFMAEEPFRIGVDVGQYTRFSVQGMSGDISIEGQASSDSIIIAGTKRVRSESVEDAEDNLENLTIDMLYLKNELMIATNQPVMSQGRGYEVDYQISLPGSMKIFADNFNGDITVESGRNLVSVGNANGQVTLNDISGSVEAGLVNGVISAEVTLPLDGTISMGVTNGGIDLDIPQGTSAEFSATVANGQISILGLVLNDSEITTDSVTGTLGDGRGTIELSVTNGYITVEGL